MKLWRPIPAAILAVTLALTGCAKPAAQDGDLEADLDFTVATVDGATFDGETLAGKPAVLWFWAPWCVTCAGQAPSVRQAADQYRGKISFVGVAGLGEVRAMREFVARSKVDNLPHLADDKGVVWKRFGVTEQSTFVVLSDSGQLVFKGYLDEQGLNGKLAQLVG